MLVSYTRREFLAAGGSALTLPLVGCRGIAQAPLRGHWQTVASIPFAVQEIYPSRLGDFIHVAGGIIADPGKSIAVTNRHVKYDPSSDAWKVLSDLPAPRHHINLVGHGKRLYTLGGYVAVDRTDAWVMQKQTWIYDAESEAWQEGRSAPGPHGETVCVSLDAHIHVTGGRVPRGDRNARWDDQIDTNRHLVYDPISDQWALSAPAPTARNSAAGAVIGGLFYVVGGRTVSGGNVPANEVYDPAEDRWRSAAPLPKAQGGLSAAALDGHLYAFGGEYFAHGGGVFAESWQYSPKADAWQPVAPMPTPRHGLGTVAFGNWIYVIGGATRSGVQGTSAAVERFSV